MLIWECWNTAEIFSLFFYCSVKCFKLSYWAHHVQSLMQIDSVPIHFIPCFTYLDPTETFLMPDTLNFPMFYFLSISSPLWSLLSELSGNKLNLNKCHIFRIQRVSDHETGKQKKIYIQHLHKGLLRSWLILTFKKIGDVIF